MLNYGQLAQLEKNLNLDAENHDYKSADQKLDKARELYLKLIDEKLKSKWEGNI